MYVYYFINPWSGHTWLDIISKKDPAVEYAKCFYSNECCWMVPGTVDSMKD